LSTTDVNDADFDMKQGVYTHPVHEGGTPYDAVDNLLSSAVALVVRSGCNKCEDFEERIRRIAEPTVLRLETLAPMVEATVLRRLKHLTGNDAVPRVFIHGDYLTPPANDIHRVDLGPQIHGANKGGLAKLMNKIGTTSAQAAHGLCTIEIDFDGKMGEMEVDSDRWMGGIFKSKLMTHLGVSGKLSDFVVTCGGESFRGREPISISPHFHPGCTVHIHRRGEDEAKPQGTS